MFIDWVVVSEWGLALIVLLAAAALIGLITGRLFLRATDAHAQRR